MTTHEWAHTERHPELPGEELAIAWLTGDDDRLYLYDPDEPEAYVVGDAVEVGTDRASLPQRPYGPVRDR